MKTVLLVFWVHVGDSCVDVSDIPHTLKCSSMDEPLFTLQAEEIIISVFWEKSPRTSLEINRSFGRRVAPTRTTWRYIPEIARRSS